MYDSGQLPESDAISGQLQTCRGRAAECLDRLYRRFIAALDTSLKTLADDPAFDPARRDLYEELRLLQLNRDKLGSLLQDHFNTCFRHAVTAGAGHYRPPAESGEVMAGLSLVDDHQLEEMLTIDRFTARILEEQDREVRALVRRFEHLLSIQPIGRSGLPIAPNRFFQAFQQAFDSFELSLKSRIYCHELIGEFLSEELGVLYPDCNRMLTEGGILPDLVIDAETPAPQSRQRPRSSPEDDGVWSDEVDQVGDEDPVPMYGTGIGTGAGTGSVRGSTSIQEQMFQAMQYLLNAHFSNAGDGTAGSAAADLPVTPMLVDTLSVLQHDEGLVTRTGELIRGGLKHHVMGRFACSSKSGDGINRIDDETIDVISMIFDYILDDPSLPDFIKALIGRLQIPVLKVAILDREFFSRKSHPARQLLNELSRAGLGWREEREASRDRLFQKMETIVRRILDEFEGDITIFEILLNEFRTFLDEEDRGFDEAQTRLLAAAQENERNERIRVEIAQEIARRLADARLPQEIETFITVSWREYVTTLALEADSGLPADALTFIDELVWSLQPKHTPEARKRLIAMLPGLLDTLRHGMSVIGHDPEQTATLIASLEQHHFDSMRPVRPKAPPPADNVDQPAANGTTEPEHEVNDDVDRAFNELTSELDQLSSIDWDEMMNFDDIVEEKSPDHQHAFDRMIAEMGLELDRDDGPRIEDEFTAQVRALELGNWVELTDEQGQVLRARLAWKGDDYSNFSFMSRQYKVVAERPLYVLADDFRHGRATVIEHAAPFDRAINGVIAGITRLAGAAER